jgi:hypothetical protein
MNRFALFDRFLFSITTIPADVHIDNACTLINFVNHMFTLSSFPQGRVTGREEQEISGRAYIPISSSLKAVDSFVESF